MAGYLVASEGPPARVGLAYDYVLAGDGLYLATENAFLSVRVPVAPAAVRGLPKLYPACSLTKGPLPVSLWHGIVRAARATAAAGLEVLMAVEYVAGEHGPGVPEGDGVGRYRLVFPRQLAGALSVVYRPLGRVVLEIHSHHRLPARFSATDDADEQRLCLYGVVGCLDCDRPQVALRVGAYGYYLPVPWETVFAGDDEARRAVHDAHFDGPFDDPRTAGEAGRRGGLAAGNAADAANGSNEEENQSDEHEDAAWTPSGNTSGGESWPRWVDQDAQEGGGG